MVIDMSNLIHTSIQEAESALECALSNGREMYVLAAVHSAIPRIRGEQTQKSRLKMLCKMGRKALSKVEKEMGR